MKGRLYDKLCTIDDTSQAAALSEEATVYCGECGAESHDPTFVCEPVSISERKSFPKKG